MYVISVTCLANVSANLIVSYHIFVLHIIACLNKVDARDYNQTQTYMYPKEVAHKTLVNEETGV